jgi:hypothetical protein
MTTRVNFLGRPFPTIVSDAELSAEDSRRVTAARQRVVMARFPDGKLDPIDLSDGDYDVVDD